MTAEQLICGLAEKYDGELNWRLIPQNGEYAVIYY